jgi:hypothetical protein
LLLERVLTDQQRALHCCLNSYTTTRCDMPRSCPPHSFTSNALRSEMICVLSHAEAVLASRCQATAWPQDRPH